MLITVFVAVAVFTAARGYGTLLLRLLGVNGGMASLGAGLWLLGTGVFLAGLSGALTPVVFGLLLAPGLMISCGRAIGRRRPPGFPPRPDRLELLLILSAALPVLAALAGSLTPPVMRDSLLYHLALPKLYLEQGRWFETPHNICGYYPGLVEALYTLTLGLGAARPAVIHFAFGVACLAAAMELGRLVGLDRRYRLLAVLILTITPLFWAEMTWAYVDLANAFFWLLTFIVYLRWRREKSMGWLVVLGLSLGAANAVKYTSLLLFAVLPLGLLVELRRSGRSGGREIAGTLLVPLAVGMAAVSPWWLRNIVWTNNPFFPFFYGLFPSESPGWDAGRAMLYQLYLDRFGGTEKSWLDLLAAPFRVFVNGRFGLPEYFDGEAGPFYLLLLPLAVMVPAAARRFAAGAGLILILIFLVFWSFSSQQARFLLAVLPIMAVLIVLFLQEVSRGLSGRRSRRVLAGLAVLLLLPGSVGVASMFGEKHFPYLSGREDRDAYLARHLAYWPIYRHINRRLPGNARLFLVMTGNQGYYLRRPYFSDSIFEGHTFAALIKEAGTAEEIAAVFEQQRWSHLLIGQDYFFRARGRHMAPAELGRYRSFLERYCRLLKQSGAYRLYAVRPPAGER